MKRMRAAFAPRPSPPRGGRRAIHTPEEDC